MMLSANFVRKHLVMISISIFIVAFTVLNWAQPDFLYNKDGSLRQFGIGRKMDTVIPVWLLAILIAIFSYLLALALLFSKTRVA